MKNFRRSAALEQPSGQRIKILAHRVIEWVNFSNKKGSKPHGNWAVKRLRAVRKQAWYFHGDIEQAGTTIVGRVCAFGISTNSNGARSFR
jgi:hypothetical protein